MDPVLVAALVPCVVHEGFDELGSINSNFDLNRVFDQDFVTDME